MAQGTDVQFGSLTRSMITHLVESGVVSLFPQHEVNDLTQEDGRWNIECTDLVTKTLSQVTAKFVFI